VDRDAASGATVFEVWDRKSYRKEVLAERVEPQVFTLRFIKAKEAREVIDIFLTPEIGIAVPVDSSRTIVVKDLPEVLNRIPRILEKIDREPTRPDSSANAGRSERRTDPPKRRNY
jgi:type II secretory pathway component GspD/PulD (secretin)